MSTATMVSGFHPDFRDLYKGFQSNSISSADLRQMSSVLDRQLQLVNLQATSLLNLPLSSQGTPLPALRSIPNFSTVNPPAKQHPPLTASNSVANCNAASHLKALTVKEHRKLDRSISEPVCQQTLRSVQSNSSRYKTELCRPFEESGICKYGDKCQFAHGVGELRTLSRHPKYKTELCRTFHTSGLCPYGPRCHFIHNSDDSKMCMLNSLQSSSIPVVEIPQLPMVEIPCSKQMARDFDICGFSIGSAGELSPTESSSSNGSPPDSFKDSSFLNDKSFPKSNVPQTAPPTVSNGVFFGRDFNPIKSLPALSTLAQYQEMPACEEECVDDDVISSIDMLVSDLDINEHDGSYHVDTPANTCQSAANVIRLPIFNSLAIGNMA